MNIARRSIISAGMATMMLGGLTLLSNQAHADLVFINNSSFTGSGMYGYDLNFSDNTDTGTGQPSQRLINGSYATVYDISGLTNVALNPTYAGEFTISEQNTGITPPGTAPNDNPALPNVTVTYTGPTLTADQSFPDLLNLTSTFTSTNDHGQFTSEVTKNTGADAGTLIDSIGNVAVPGVTATTPEPGSFALFIGAGLSGSVFAYRRRRNRK